MTIMTHGLEGLRRNLRRARSRQWLARERIRGHGWPGDMAAATMVAAWTIWCLLSYVPLALSSLHAPHQLYRPPSLLFRCVGAWQLRSEHTLCLDCQRGGGFLPSVSRYEYFVLST